MPTDRSETRDNQTRPYWLLVAVAPIITAVLTALRIYIDTRLSNGYPNWREVIFTFFDWAGLGALAPLIYFLARRYRIKRPFVLRGLLVHLLGALTVSFIWALEINIVATMLGTPRRRGGLLKMSLSWTLDTLPFSLLLYILMLGCVWASLYYREARERESQQARLSMQLAEARLSALRMQLNPHFLFNSLNAITVLVRDHRSDDASHMLELLSDVLREVLQSKKNAETRLSEEMAFIEKYLAIEQVRFSDRLDVRWSIEPTTHDIAVPEFILQPLVENAIRHGIGKHSGHGLIEIIANESNGEIVLSVRDNGSGYHTFGEEGVGLGNTRERLVTLYGSSGHLDLKTVEEGGSIATVRFPIRRS